MSQESAITLQLVHGGFILHTPCEELGQKTEVFVSQGKMMKSLRTAIEQYSLVAKAKAGDADEAAE